MRRFRTLYRLNTYMYIIVFFILYRDNFERDNAVLESVPKHNFTGHSLFPYLEILPRLFVEKWLKLLFRWITLNTLPVQNYNGQKSFT